jgi:ABC-2 type transport system ATP-binding protein
MPHAIKVNEVYREYPGVKALNGISFAVSPQTVHGFLGPNGAGKTTMMKIITTLIPMNAGSVEVLGLNILEKEVEVKKLIGFLPENPPLYPNMRVEDYLLFVAQLHGLAKKEAQKNVGQTISDCGLSSYGRRLIGNLSKGLKQRVGIAQCLAYRPALIILDEPMVGLDPQSIVEIRELIMALGKEHTIFLSSHQLHEVQTMCSEITVIHQGKALASGPIQEIAKKVQGHQIISLEIKRWEQGLERDLRQRLALGDFKVQSLKNGHFGVHLQLQSDGDHREEIGQFCLQKNLGLLSLNEERLSLEEIFGRITGEQH